MASPIPHARKRRRNMSAAPPVMIPPPSTTSRRSTPSAIPPAPVCVPPVGRGPWSPTPGVAGSAGVATGVVAGEVATGSVDRVPPSKSQADRNTSVINSATSATLRALTRLSTYFPSSFRLLQDTPYNVADFSGNQISRPPPPCDPRHPHRVGTLRLLGRLAQLARALRLQRRGRGFESLSAHYQCFVLLCLVRSGF
jgi:hypothetical protein